MVELIRFSDLPEILVGAGIVVGVFWVVSLLWKFTVSPLAERWRLRKATPVEDYDE